MHERGECALAEGHRSTEALLEEVGIPFVLLRNGYAVVGSAGGNRTSGASRANYAEAATMALLGGDPAGTVAYRDLPIPAYASMLTSSGLPEALAERIADSDLVIARGDLVINGGDLRNLIGRPTTSLADAVRDAVAA
ncbi:hypothetical protein [Agrococcus beijingensis]|uniref:hypothetical protein n=1 Tax=Agrococcus beijingensis TaxID=3068634 RepID=UPI00274247A9|nr:hypothetical protein [Agrococcus sp. REN33]